MTSALAVFLGGGTGALLRAFLVPIGNRLSQTGFPFGVLLVNITGCLLVGLVIGYASMRQPLPPVLHAFLVIGVLGGFTTFSAFAADTLKLLNSGQALQAVAYVMASMVLSLAAAFIGYSLIRQVAV